MQRVTYRRDQDHDGSLSSALCYRKPAGTRRKLWLCWASTIEGVRANMYYERQRRKYGDCEK
jgi:hypothetical protein